MSSAPTRVLLVEDNPGFTYAIRDMLLRGAGAAFDLASASSFAEAASMIRASMPHLILLDLGLPDSAGAATYDRIRAKAPFVPIIVLTALDDGDVASQTMRRGAQDYLIKDQVDRHLLVRSIRYALERGHAEENLRQLSGRILRLQDEERRHLARELHDVTAQHLAAVLLNLSFMKKHADSLPPEMRHRVEETARLIDRCAAELRTMSYVLHPPLLEELGLAGVLQDFLSGFSRRSGIEVNFTMSQDPGRLSLPLETTLFRILQECLTNIQRHAYSATAEVSLGREGEWVRLEVQDHGRGIPSRLLDQLPGSAAGVGVGIAGMFERARQMGGRLEIMSDSSGTTVTALLPAEAGA